MKSIAHRARGLSRLARAAWNGLPVLIALMAMAATLLIGRALRVREQAETKKTVTLVAQNVKSRILAGIQTRILPLERMATRWSIREEPHELEWESDANLFYSAYTAYDSIQWVDPSYNVRWAVPLRQDWTAYSNNLVRRESAQTTFEEARKHRFSAGSRTMPLSEGGRGFLIAVPISSKGNFAGFIVGTFRAQELLSLLLDEYLPHDYWILVCDAGEQIYKRSNATIPERPNIVIETPVSLLGMSWTVRVGPTAAGLSASKSNLPITIYLTGAAMSVLLSLTTLLGQTAHRRAKTLEHVNTELERQVTQRKEWAEALRQAKERLEAVIQTSPLAIIALDPKGLITSWNPTAERMWGWKEGDVVQRRLPAPAEGQPNDARTLLEGATGGEALAGVEGRLQTRDGFWVEVAIWTAKLREPTGAISGLLAVLADISEQKRLQERLRDSQKMELIGRLAGGIAHDFNNLLTVINGYSNLLLESLPSVDPLRKNAEEILQAGNRAAALTSQLLAFSRRQPIQPIVLDLNHLVTNISTMLGRLIGEHIQLKILLDCDLGPVNADPSQIEQVLINLVTNARDAMQSGGILTIETANSEIDELQGCQQEIRPGPYVRLAVSDTGAGMDPEIRRHVFEPFFTTKKRGKGTGLGLSSVYGSVKQNHGSIVVASEPGRGTAFSIYLPRLLPAHESAGADVPTQHSSRGTETILLAEDESSLRRMVREMLEGSGYRVLEASDGADAIRVCERYADVVNLLLTDVVMPLLNGRELAKRLTQRWPQMKVIYMSGYTDDVIAYHGVSDEALNLIQKPFRLDALSARIREVLDQTSSPL
jgi:PAS domain S-box-containing protein